MSFEYGVKYSLKINAYRDVTSAPIVRLGYVKLFGSRYCGSITVTYLLLFCSAVARQLLISARDLQVQDTVGLSEESSAERSIDSSSKGAVPESSRLCVLVFEPLIGDYKSSVSHHTFSTGRFFVYW